MSGILSHSDAIARLEAMRDAPPSDLPWTMEDDGNDYVISAPEVAVEIARIPHAEGADTDAIYLITAANTYHHALVTIAALYETLEQTAQTITDLRNELEQLPEELRVGVGGREPPKAAKSDKELHEALALVKAMGRWGGRSVYRRDDAGAFVFVRHATQAEDDAWGTIFQTGLAAGWRTAAERDQARQQADDAIAMLREIRRACIASVRGAEHAAAVSVDELEANLASTPVDVANLIARAETAEAEVMRLKVVNASLENGVSRG